MKMSVPRIFSLFAILNKILNTIFIKPHKL